MHLLEILEKHIRITRQITKKQYKARKFDHKRGSADIKERPLTVGYLTIGQLLYILTEIQRNYLTDHHVFSFNKETFIVRVVKDDTEEVEHFGFKDEPPRSTYPFIQNLNPQRDIPKDALR